MMLEIVDGYSRDFKVKFGGDKSKVMVINGDETDRDREWNFGEVKIGRTKENKYLGCMLSEDGCARAKGGKVAKAMQWWGRLSSVAKYRANLYINTLKTKFVIMKAPRLAASCLRSYYILGVEFALVAGDQEEQ
ncbi:hypothetical protein FHG87_009348 [Trinorchestia longiramus]|nr:hypothetical protein FHG87_009348 [Trinorchestia longiramus]